VQPAQLNLKTSKKGPACTITLAGELDMGTASTLESAVEQALGEGARELVLDMRAVAFTDSSGLRAILRARRSLEEAGGEFFLVPSEGGEQHHLFNVSGTIGALTFREPDDQASG
jgi:anti-anti-sigma factor